MGDEATTETNALLREIRDLLLPVADAYRDAYEERQAVREEERLSAIRALLSSDKRRKAWELADGSRSQREIAKEAKMDEGGTSRFFKILRDLNAITGAPNPVRTVEV